MVSVELGVTVALIELTLGVVVGQRLRPAEPGLARLHRRVRLDRPDLPRRDGGRSRRTCGVASAPRSGSASSPSSARSSSRPLVAYFLLDWSGTASLIAGTALSTTSLAVVYAVLVERGLTDTNIGKLLMSATFVTDLCTALALSAIFIKPNVWFPVFLVVSLALILALPRIAPWFFGRYGDRVIEPEIKLVFACLLLLMVLADARNGHAVLPAFVLGLVMSQPLRASTARSRSACASSRSPS